MLHTEKKQRLEGGTVGDADGSLKKLSKSRWSSDDDEEDKKTRDNRDNPPIAMKKDPPSFSTSGHAVIAAVEEVETNYSVTDNIDRGGLKQAPIDLRDANSSSDISTHAQREYNPLINGCRSVECYQRLNYISQGTYGVVFRARDINTNEIVAIKQIKFDRTEPKQGKLSYKRLLCL